MHRGFSSMRWNDTALAMASLTFGGLLAGVGVANGHWETLPMGMASLGVGIDQARHAWADWMEHRVPGIPGPCHCRKCAPELH